MSVSEEKLIAFVDGELSGAELADVERAIASDAEVRARVEAHQRLRAKLSMAFDGALSEPVPERLRAATAAPKAAEVVSLADRREQRAKWSFREFGAMAASLAGGLIIGLGVMSNGNASMIAQTGDGLVARGALAQALDTQLASDDAGAVRIGLSFRDQQGSYCRTFDAQGTAGLACNDGDSWNVAMTAASGPTGEVRQASAPAAILAAVDEMIEGDVLDAEAEASARDAGWR